MNIKLKEYTVNTAQIVISDNNNSITCYYSYTTLIAIKDIDNVYYVSEHVFDNGKGRLSQTTGKHLNAIEIDKNKRLKREKFEKIANKIINFFFLQQDNKKVTLT